MSHSDPLDGRIREALADVVAHAPISPDFDDITAGPVAQHKRPMRPIAWAAAAVVAMLVAGVALAGTDDATVDTGMAGQDSEQDSSAATPCEHAATGFAADDSDVIVFLQPDSTQEQQDGVARAIQDAPGVEVVRFVDQQATYDEFRDLFADSPEIVESVTAEILPPRFELRVNGSERIDVVAEVLDSKPGVRDVIDADQAKAEMREQCGDAVADAAATPTTTIVADDGEEAVSGADPSASSDSDVSQPTSGAGDQTVGLPGGQCGTRMLEVATGDGWTLSRGVKVGLPSLYEVSVDGELALGGCGSDVRAKEAGYMPWFSAHVPDGVLLFGEVPAGVPAVAVNGDVVEAVEHQGTDSALVIIQLPYSDGDRSNVTLEAVRSDGSRAPLAPAVIGPDETNHAFTLDFSAV